MVYIIQTRNLIIVIIFLYYGERMREIPDGWLILTEN